MPSKKFIKIRRLLLDIDWVQPKFKQKRAMRRLSKLRGENLEWLLFSNPYNPKSCWENSAKVLKKIGYPEIKEFLPKIIYWLVDFNWPGAKEIYDLLLTVPNDTLLKNIEISMVDFHGNPNVNDDYMFISKLVFEKGIKKEDFKNINCYKILKATHEELFKQIK